MLRPLACVTRQRRSQGLPLQGHGLAYGTKEGRLRLVRQLSSVPEPIASDKLGQDVTAQLGATQTARLGQELAEADQVAASDGSDQDE